MATLLFKFVFLDNSTPAAALTSTELTGGDAPTVNISKTTLAAGVVSSEVSGGALTYDSYTKSWHYRLAGADLATYLYVGMATTSYADAAQADVHALGIVVPDELVSQAKLAETQGAVTWGQQKIIASVNGEGALEIQNNAEGYGMRNIGILAGMHNYGDNAGQLNETWPGSSGAGQWNKGDDANGYGQKNSGNTPVDPASPTAQQVRDAMMLAPTAGSPATGSVDEHLDELLTRVPDATPGAEGGLPVLDANSVVAANVTYWNSGAVGGAPVSAGSGSTAYTITVQDEDSNPLDGVEVWLSTDSAGTNVVAGTLSTDASGQATFMLDAGTYYVWRQLSGYNFANPVAITVS